MNRHQFEQAARMFRAGRLTLADFTQQFISAIGGPTGLAADDATTKVVESSAEPPTNKSTIQFLRLPKRPDDAHKNSCGHVLVIAGSQSMPGAAALVGMSALKSGAGLVTVATSAEAHSIVAGFSPCLMVVPLGSDDNGQIGNDQRLDPLVKKANVIAVGPGLGISISLQRLLSKLYRESPLPMVLDADALNNLAISKVNFSVHKGPRILTPHVGEFRRLINQADLQGDALRSNAVEFAKSNDVVVLLKGPATLVCDGLNRYENTTGNSGMATAGSGDVLTGIVTALWGQGLSPIEAAATAAFLHGTAGDLAAAANGPNSLIATDIIEFLPKAFLNSKLA